MATFFYIVIPINLLVTSNGKRLNKNYMYSYNKKLKKYYLHHSPLFVFYYTSRDEFRKDRSKAINKFMEKHPDKELYAKTMTLQKFYEKNGYIGVEVKMGFNFVMSSFLGVLLNFRNILDCRIDLFGRIYSVAPKEYKIL